MATRYYITPLVSTGNIYPLVGSIPAYIEAEGGSILAAMTYGREPFVLVQADVTAGVNTAIALHTDVIVIPANIDNPITAGALAAVKSALETINVPADWVTTAFTYRQVLRIVGGLFQFAQRYSGLYELNIFRGGVTLDTVFNTLPANERQRLIDAATSMNYDISGLSGSNTMRQILRDLGGQWGSQPLGLGGI